MLLPVKSDISKNPSVSCCASATETETMPLEGLGISKHSSRSLHRSDKFVRMAYYSIHAAHQEIKNA